MRCCKRTHESDKEIHKKGRLSDSLKKAEFYGIDRMWTSRSLGRGWGEGWELERSVARSRSKHQRQEAEDPTEELGMRWGSRALALERTLRQGTGWKGKLQAH